MSGRRSSKPRVGSSSLSGRASKPSEVARFSSINELLRQRAEARRSLQKPPKGGPKSPTPLGAFLRSGKVVACCWEESVKATFSATDWRGAAREIADALAVLAPIETG